VKNRVDRRGRVDVEMADGNAMRTVQIHHGQLGSDERDPPAWVRAHLSSPDTKQRVELFYRTIETRIRERVAAIVDE
jgi:hypothetical protein